MGSVQRILLVSLGSILAIITSANSVQYGIDVSSYQGTVDWARVKASGKTFAVAKASEGSTYEDRTYVQNCQGMRRAGLRVGAYHYLRGAVGAAAQAAKVNSVLAKCRPDVVVVDVEQGGNEKISPTQMADTLQGVLDGIRGAASDVYIYTSASYWDSKVAWSRHDFSRYKLWVAHYTSRSSPNIPSTWKNIGYTWWQYSDKGSVDGIKGPVDLDRTA